MIGIAPLGSRQRRLLPQLLEHVIRTNPFYAERYQGLDLAGTPDDSLAQLPFTTKTEFEQDQLDTGPFGRIHALPLGEYTRVHRTSGSTGRPLWWLDTHESWEWWIRCWQTVLMAGQVSADDVVYFAFSFAPFIGFWSGFESSTKLGALTLSSGGLTTSERLRDLARLRPTVVVCTPSYALRLARVAEDAGIDLRELGVRRLLLAGEPGASLPTTRALLQQLWNAEPVDHYGLTEVGPVAVSCPVDPRRMHFNEDEFIVEVLPVQGVDGSGGELVITNLGRWGSPAIRYRTGDIVVMSSERCACGSNVSAMGGILGRVDDMLVIKGTNLFPSAVEAVVRRHTLASFQIDVEGAGDSATLTVLVEQSSSSSLTQRALALIKTSLREELGLRFAVLAVADGSLPRAGLKQRTVRRK